jgi:5,10-methylenetetrahydrofolate reductase
VKLTDLWKKKGKPTISFELFPAHNEKAAVKLDKAIEKLVELSPDFVSVTFGTGGSTKEGSYNLAAKLKGEKGLEVLPYFACWGLAPDDIVAVVDRYMDLGVDNLLTVRGDDKNAVADFEIRFAVEQCKELLKNGVPGLHIYTMDRSKSAAGIVKELRADGML